MPPVIAVLGMHRAGTSLTTAMLQSLGVRLSENLMPATEDNPIGYFEDADIVRIHDAVLESLGGRTWRTNSTMAPFPDNWMALPQVQPFKEQLKAIARRELAASPLAWGFKDPRTAQLLPLWNQIARELETDIRCVVVLRHPREVSGSLQTRDAMNPIRGELLWVEHYLDALLYSSPATRAYVNYDAWFEHAPETAAKIAGKLGLPAPDEAKVMQAVSSRVVSELRHHKVADEPCYLPFTRDFYAAMLREDEAMLQTLTSLLQLVRTFSASAVACALEINANIVGEQQQRITQLEAELAKLRR